MTALSDELRERYRQALDAYLTRDTGELALMDALDLGRAALADGHGVIDLLALHQSLTPSFIADRTDGAEIARLIRKADEFLTQIVAPFEMTHRGWHDIVDRLHRMNETLERQVAERTAALSESERRFQDIAEVGGDWIWDTDRDHRFTDLMVGNTRLMPIPLEKFVGKTRWEVAGADPDKNSYWAEHKAVVEAHRPFRGFRYSVEMSSVERLYLSVSGKPVFDDQGEFRGYRGTATDETAIIETRRRAEQAEALLRDAIESISGGFLICDAQDRIVLFNQGVRNFYADCGDTLRVGVQYEDFTRAAIAKSYYPDAIGSEEEWLAERMARHRALSDATELRLRDEHWLLVTERRMSNGGSAGVFIDITALKAAQAAFSESEARLDRAQAIAGIGSWEVNLRTGRVDWSKQMYRILGVPVEAGVSSATKSLEQFTPEDRPRFNEWFQQISAGVMSTAIECRIKRAADDVRIVSYEAIPILNDSGKVIRVAGTLRDITEQRRIEQQFMQAQKMEAIGNLTGGMAHDFNNLLGVIIGNLDLVPDSVKDSAEAADLLKDALDAALRGADLTGRLLAFARRQPLRPERVDANELISQITRLLNRTLGEDISIALDLSPSLWPVAVDPAQLQAAITNLANNARDAMPKGGKLTVTTYNSHLDEDYATHHLDVSIGDYIAIEVSDTGAGIPPDIIDRIFDPFFTTKEQGKGTGLGLSMVFGFTRQSGGHVNVYSELGSGTTFRIYLPRGAARRAEDAATEIEAPIGANNETILVVEDNARLLSVVTKQLGELGYEVLAAETAAVALDILDGKPVQLLLTDIVMPGGMDGFELAREAVSRRPNLRVLLTSGFPEARLRENDHQPLKWRLLSKPYRKTELARAVREVLDES